MTSGGNRPGSGRPKVSPDFKRQPVKFVRLPGWLVDWLRAGGNAGKIIESALIKTYKLKPPKESDNEK